MAQAKPEPARSWNKLLVRCPNWVGDAIMAVPTLRAVRLAYPKSHITLLAKPLVANLLDALPHADATIIYDPANLHRGPIRYLNFVGRLRQKGFDAALLLPNAFSSALMTFLARIPERVGFSADGRRFLLTRPIPLAKNWRSEHRVLTYMKLAGAVGAPTDDTHLELCIDEKAQDEMAQTLERYGVSTDCKVAAIHPGAAYGSAKRWPFDRYGVVARGLSERGYQSLLLGSPKEASLAGKIAAHCDRGTVVNLAGSTPTLQHLAALLARCDAVICNDSGPMHMAAALGLPLVAIFGSTSPEFTRPHSEKAEVVSARIDCSPCFRRECPNGTTDCLKKVSPEMVLAAFDRVMKGHP